MAQITLDKEMKVALLKWLKQGYIDGMEHDMMFRGKETMTIEEINKELDRFTNWTECERCRRMGYCAMELAIEDIMPKQLEAIVTHMEKQESSGKYKYRFGIGQKDWIKRVNNHLSKHPEI